MLYKLVKYDFKQSLGLLKFAFYLLSAIVLFSVISSTLYSFILTQGYALSHHELLSYVHYLIDITLLLFLDIEKYSTIIIFIIVFIIMTALIGDLKGGNRNKMMVIPVDNKCHVISKIIVSVIFILILMCLYIGAYFIMTQISKSHLSFNTIALAYQQINVNILFKIVVNLNIAMYVASVAFLYYLLSLNKPYQASFVFWFNYLSVIGISLFSNLIIEIVSNRFNISNIINNVYIDLFIKAFKYGSGAIFFIIITIKVMKKLDYN